MTTHQTCSPFTTCHVSSKWIHIAAVASLSGTYDDRKEKQKSRKQKQLRLPAHCLRRKKRLVRDSMLKLEEGEGLAGLVTGSVGWARPCDSCQLAACLVYCQADTAYLCASCDGRVHAANQLASRHERVWVCEVCERAPAVMSCKADAAFLCADCDADIHSANPLAVRHHRLPVLPVSPEEVAAGRRARVVPPMVDRSDGDNVDEEASWSLLDSMAKGTTQSDSGFVYDGEIDEYLDLGEYNSCGDHQEERDGMVPAAARLTRASGLNQQQHHQNLRLQMNHDAPKVEFCYTPDSMGHHASLSSVVSDAASVVGRGSTEPLSVQVLPHQTQPQLVPMDREARVQRYREKKKTRKFEKTIRYASRKAYAEIRPRIKGRFAKRSDQLLSVDGSCSYGLVPTL